MKNALLKTMNVVILVLITTMSSMVMAEDKKSMAESDLESVLMKSQGNVIYLDFWASWCAPCRKSFPWMQEMQEKYGEKGLTIVTINVDEDKSNAIKFLEEMNSTLTVVYDSDGELSKKLNVRGMPSSFILNKKGKLTSSHTGFKMSKIDEYEKDITDLLH